jgi:hypothetical protein
LFCAKARLGKKDKEKGKKRDGVNRLILFFILDIIFILYIIFVFLIF